MSARIAVSLALVATLALPARAADRHTIAVLNVAGTSVMTYLGCMVQTKVLKRPTSSSRCLLAGAVGGVGYYEAKRLAGDGHVGTAWLVANLSSSVIENTLNGEHPLARVGYTFGPMRFRVATPFDRERASWVDLDLSLAETGFLARAIVDADDIDIRDGMIWWETRDPDREGNIVYHGYTWGIYPGVWSGARTHVWNHEAVHAVQALQLDSVEPPVIDLARGRHGDRRTLLRLRSIRGGVLNVTDNVLWAQAPYENRWVEIEAYRFAEDDDPPR